MQYIPYGCQDISEKDIQSVINVLNSDWLTQGPSVEKFEDAVCAQVGAKYGITVCNATAALHLACMSLNVGRGDFVWTTPNTFVASANCGLYCGASVDFVDIDESTYNMSTVELARKLAKAKIEGKLPKVVIPVHFAGQSCDMGRIKQLSDKYGFKIIEDASHAIGASYENNYIGGCTFSDITVFSFHPVKIITTGEGGICLTNNEDLAEKIRLLRSHGITKDKGKMTGEPDGPWAYQMHQLGYNYRITDLQCALGLSQLSKLSQIIKKRNTLATQYIEMLSGLPIKFQNIKENCLSAYHLFVIQLFPNSKASRLEVF